MEYRFCLASMRRSRLHTKNLTTGKQLHITYFLLIASDGACQFPSDLTSALLGTTSQGLFLPEQGERMQSLDFPSILMYGH